MHILHVFLVSRTLVKLLHLTSIWGQSGKYAYSVLRMRVVSLQPQSSMFAYSCNPQWVQGGWSSPLCRKE